MKTTKTALGYLTVVFIAGVATALLLHNSTPPANASGLPGDFVSMRLIVDGGPNDYSGTALTTDGQVWYIRVTNAGTASESFTTSLVGVIPSTPVATESSSMSELKAGFNK